MNAENKKIDYIVVISVGLRQHSILYRGLKLFIKPQNFALALSGLDM